MVGSSPRLHLTPPLSGHPTGWHAGTAASLSGLFSLFKQPVTPVTRRKGRTVSFLFFLPVRENPWEANVMSGLCCGSGPRGAVLVLLMEGTLRSLNGSRLTFYCLNHFGLPQGYRKAYVSERPSCCSWTFLEEAPPLDCLRCPRLEGQAADLADAQRGVRGCEGGLLHFDRRV